MKRVLIAIFFLSVTAECFSQHSSDIYAAYIFGKAGGFNGTQDLGGTFLGGANWYKKLSKKNYTVGSVHAVTGFRLVRSGYKMEGYDPFPNKTFYDKYGVTHIQSSLMQYMVTVPIGIDFQFRNKPVKNPRSSSSIKLMLNNSFMVYGNLKESVTYDEFKKTNVTSYASKYVPGFTVETRLEFLVVGLTWQRVTYKIPVNKLNIDENTGSPFYELFSKNGKYNDFYLYFGLVVPLKNELAQKNK
jgi:hypothetical protein